MASNEAGAKVILRKAWFQVHKWIGLLLAVVIIPVSLSGSILVWDEWVSNTLHPERNVAAAPTRTPAFYADAARKALAPNETLANLTYPEDTGPVVASAARETPGAPRGGRPVRTQLYLDPATGAVLDKASSDSGFVRVMHVLHGSLMVPGVGRQIVGWIGVAMLISSLSGLWLWWPFTGRFSSGFRWRRRQAPAETCIIPSASGSRCRCSCCRSRARGSASRRSSPRCRAPRRRADRAGAGLAARHKRAQA